MYIYGLVKTSAPRVLIDPVPASTIDELYEKLTAFLNQKDFSLDPPITKDRLSTEIAFNELLQVEFAGYEVALLIGSHEAIYKATDRFVHVLD